MWVVARGASYAMPSLLAEVGEGRAYGLCASGCSGLWAGVGEGRAYGLRAFSLLFTFDSKCLFLSAFGALHHIGYDIFDTMLLSYHLSNFRACGQGAQL